jgi:hypothetical protein
MTPQWDDSEREQRRQNNKHTNKQMEKRTTGFPALRFAFQSLDSEELQYLRELRHGLCTGRAVVCLAAGIVCPGAGVLVIVRGVVKAEEVQVDGLTHGAQQLLSSTLLLYDPLCTVRLGHRGGD